MGEVDGAVKYVDPYGVPAEALLAEKRRQERIEDAGHVVVRWGAAEVERAPDAVIERILRASARAQQMYGAPAMRVDLRSARPMLT